MAILTYFIIGVMYPFLVYMILGCMLKPRWTKYTLAFYAMWATLIFQIPTIIRGLTDTWYDAMGYVQLAIMIGSAIALFKDKVWLKVFAMIIYYFLAIISEVITFAFLGDWVVGVDFYGNSIEALIIQLIIIIVTFTFMGVVTVLWNILFKRSSFPKNIFLFLLFPLGQICMIDTWSAQIHSGAVQFASSFNVLIGLMIGFIADAILFYVMFMQGEKEQLKYQLEETERLMAMEKAYFKSIEERHEEVAKIRHDFNNQLTAIMHLYETDDKDNATELLNELRKCVDDSKGHIWCGNSVVNAILNDKYYRCKKADIDLHTEIDLRENVSINSLHLCSIFSNLLDNAIRAAEEVEQGKRNIFVRVIQQGRYLHIKVKNSSLKPIVKNDVGHGYGVRILTTIAHQYNGEYQGGWENGEYISIVILEL